MHLYKPATVIHKVVCCSLVVFKSRLIPETRAKGQRDRRLKRQASSSKITIVSMHGHSATLSACMPNVGSKRKPSVHLYKPATVIHQVVCCSLVVFKSRLIQKRAKGQNVEDIGNISVILAKT